MLRLFIYWFIIVLAMIIGYNLAARRSKNIDEVDKKSGMRRERSENGAEKKEDSGSETV